MMVEILYGYHPVREALRAGKRALLEIWLPTGKSSPRVDEVASLAAAAHVSINRVSMGRIESMAATDAHQGICASAGPYVWSDFSLFLKTAHGSNPFLLLLDHIVDPHNLGALLRTAFCAGLDGVVITKDRSAQPTPAVSKTSAGTMEHISLARVTNMVSTIKTLKESGLWVAGLDKHTGQNIYTSDLSGPIALVIGSEEKGIRPLVKKNCDLMIAIPQVGDVDSLNASVAGGVVMYETYRQRHVGAMSIIT
ncbi:23S rRNA (guanosine(2251)-2'-O)-methyltransferase RlmB [Thermodesulfobacteriota bacterium]